MIRVDEARDRSAGCRAVDELLIDGGEQGIAVPDVICARRIRRAANDGAHCREALIRIVRRRRRAGLHDARSEFVVGIRRRGIVVARGEHAVEIVPHVAPAAGLDEIAVGVVGIGCRGETVAD